jgi:hypothetical protein
LVSHFDPLYPYNATNLKDGEDMTLALDNWFTKHPDLDQEKAPDLFGKVSGYDFAVA